MLKAEENELARDVLANPAQGPSSALELASKILGCSPIGRVRASKG
jgi:hypothetical protein